MHMLFLKKKTVEIKFYYQNNQHSYKHEVIITSFADAVAKIIELPKSLEVCLYPLPDNVYGGIDMNHVNRIGINYDLPFNLLPKILTHELIHVHQKHIGILSMKSNGMCYWHGIPYTKKLPEDMTYEEYNSLPWEVDVAQKQQEIFREALALVCK